MMVLSSNQFSASGSTDEPVVPPQLDGENQLLAQLLHEIAVLLASEGASDFRVSAYDRASHVILRLPIGIRTVYAQDGLPGLIKIPSIGESIAHCIEQFLHSGHIPLLDQLHGDTSAEHVFATLPGIGTELSRRIHHELGIESLPELIAAIDDGRLATVDGIGRKRVRTIRECVMERLRHADGHPSQSEDAAAHEQQISDKGPQSAAVHVSEILDVDAEYRRLASAGKLHKIAPKKLNPDHSRWLPVLHTQRGHRHYTALYSNSQRAHDFHTLRDWVVIIRDDPNAEDRWTVITSQFGRLKGYRIVRGREPECEELYLPHG